MRCILSSILLLLFICSAAAQSTIKDAMALIERKQNDSARTVLTAILDQDEKNGRAYLESDPDGGFASLAEAKVKELSP